MEGRMTLAEVVAELVLVDAALAKLYEAQSYGIGSRNLQRVQYKDLIARKNQLERMQDRLSSTDGGAATNPIFGPAGGVSDRNGIDP